MLINSFLVQGAGAALASRLNTVSSLPLDALVLMSLGADFPTLINTVDKANIDCPVYLTETYGIIGYDDDLGRNVELMEKGRGQEYGFQGGSGGQGCLALAFSQGAVAGHIDSAVPQDASSLMVIADTSGTFAEVSGKLPLHYGGITKEAWFLNNGELEKVPYFWVASQSRDCPIGVSAFKGDASEATEALMSKLPSGWQPSGQVGLFPCYTRGVNHYGAENVEVDAITSLLSEKGSTPHIFGMFAHGELGPSSFSGFMNEKNDIECEKHSMTSILSIHTLVGEASS